MASNLMGKTWNFANCQRTGKPSNHLLGTFSAKWITTIFIPYPYAFKDHQYFNAKYLVDKKLAWVIRESEIDKEKILKTIFENEESLAKISESLIKMTPRSGSKDIVKEILNCMK